MENVLIADMLTLLSKLMDIHGENAFKVKSYQSAAFTIDRLTVPVETLPPEKIAALKGVGKSTAEKISEIIQTGKLQILDNYIQQTPPGILEMLQVKGLGPKKIHIIWKEMGIENIGELLYACKENRLKLYKGFGEKTQASIISAIEFMLQNMGHFLYAQTIEVVPVIFAYLTETFGTDVVFESGDTVRQSPIIEALSFIITLPKEQVLEALGNTGFIPELIEENCITYKARSGIKVKLYPALPEEMPLLQLKLTASTDFYNAIINRLNGRTTFESEAALFKQAGLAVIPAYLRESADYIMRYNPATQLITEEQITGIIHTHSNWSDGSNTIEEMAQACIVSGKEYLVISDHSVSAFYANGLNTERIMQQHQYIDTLNDKLAPFKIFKSIECDILYDGRLDYNDAVLASFDLVIASVHSNLNMTEEKAMQRIMAAIQNPYTTILGHPTGRLLLSRNGYPLNMQAIIDACVANNVVIELNANPNRLDIDWKFIPYALEKGALISINPDAHSIEGISDIHFGVLAAQKGMLTAKHNLSSFSLQDFETLIDRKKSGNNR
jgi:DNA polymerase (family 10)